MADTEKVSGVSQWVALVGLDDPLAQQCRQAATAAGCDSELLTPEELGEQLGSRQSPVAVVLGPEVPADAVSPALARLGVSSRVLVVDGLG